MSVIERGQNFLKDVGELNREVASKYFEIQKESVESFIQANRDRFAALRDIKSVNDLVESERRFYAAVRDNVTSSVKKQFDLARHNFESSRDLMLELVGQKPAKDAAPAQPAQA
jgi:hypothetical protein